MSHRPGDERAEVSAPGGGTADAGTGRDWRDIFYLNAFLNLSLSDRQIQRRERVWIKRFLANRGKPEAALLERGLPHQRLVRLDVGIATGRGPSLP